MECNTATQLNLPEFEKYDRETGGIMSNITGLNGFYYLSNFHDMCCNMIGGIYYLLAVQPITIGR